MYDLVLGVIEDNEPVVEQVPRVALPAVAIEDLAACWQISQALDDKTVFIL